MAPGHKASPAPGEDWAAWAAWADWAALEDAVKRFVTAWRHGPRPALDDYLIASEALRYPLLIELVHTDLELRLKAGEAARVEEYLARYPELVDDNLAVFELVAAEYELRRRREPQLRIDHYESRFPGHAAELSRKMAEATVLADGPRQDTPLWVPERRPEAFPDVAGYEVLSLLGQGGMGVVYQARQISLNRLVALKFLPADCAKDPLWLERFRREASTASALNHPHICTIYDTGDCAGRPFISMEFIEGQTLEAVLKRRPAMAELVSLIGQAAEALAAAHAAGVVHRDVKPQNVMVRGDGIVKVLDFGLARQVAAERAQGMASALQSTAPGVRVGTVLYMSPEQARAEFVETASDVFSLGLVLYELATGKHPFPADSELVVLQAIATQTPVPPARLNPEVPAALDALILRMLAKDSRLRPTAAEVATALAELTMAPRAGSGAGARTVAPPATTMVGRQPERLALRAAFEGAAAGHGSMLCVTGEPGLGKTTLVEDFLDELVTEGQSRYVARGRCSERLAGAEAYLPFLEALDSLLNSPEGAATAQTLKLLAPTWYVQLAPLTADDPSLARVLAEARDASQERRKRELVAFFQETSRRRPLVLFLDDVHWADPSSVDLLAYLGSRCTSLRMLLLLTYRPSDLLRSQHPFGPVKLDLQGRGVCREIGLPFLSRADLDRYLSLAFAGHQFPEEFAAAIHAKTEGNPLFMVNLLRFLRQQGVIAETEGNWSLVQPMPDLRRGLPESVRSMIQRKMDFLDEGDLRLLTTASVQGYEFDSTVLAEAVELDVADVEDRLRDLEQVQGLVRLVREGEFPDHVLTLRYAFVHVLYQEALYARVSPTRKATLSAAVGRILQQHHGPDSPTVACELACLFEVGRDYYQAAQQLHLAALNAARLAAHQEAVAMAERGLKLVRLLPPSPERAALELSLQMTLGLQLQVTRGYADPRARDAYHRARELCEELGDSAPLFPVLWGLWLCHKVGSELDKAQELAEALSALARALNDPDLALQAHQALGMTAFCRGQPEVALRHTEQTATLYDPSRHHVHAFLFGQDPGVICKAYGAVCLWLLGYADTAVWQSDLAIELSRELSPTCQAVALHFAAMLHQLRQDPHRTLHYAEASAAIASEHGFSFWLAGSNVLKGWALTNIGTASEGLDRLRHGLEQWQATGSLTYLTYYLGLLAEALARDGQPEAGRAKLTEALTLTYSGGERLWEAELYRLQGELLLSAAADSSTHVEAEACFHRALDVARQQSAKALELRAAMSLARLFSAQGRLGDAKETLANTYDWFTEGLDTHDLQQARAMLVALL